MGSSIIGSIGHKIGVLQARILILSIHVWCMSLQWNGCPFFWITCSGPVYDDTSGIKCARYCTSPRKCCTSCLFQGSYTEPQILMDSIRSPGKLLIQYLEFIWSPSGVHLEST